jgi:hypothetical protein
MNSRPLPGRSDVLIHSKQVVWIVSLLQGGEALVIVAVRGFDARLSFIVHHEVCVRSFQIERMDRLPIVPYLLLQDRGHGRIGINADNGH